LHLTLRINHRRKKKNSNQQADFFHQIMLLLRYIIVKITQKGAKCKNKTGIYTSLPETMVN